MNTLSFFSKTVPTIFFKLCTTKEGINTYQMAKTPSKLIHFPRSYGPKRGQWRHRVQKRDGPSYTIRLYLGGNGWVNVFSLTEVRLSVGGLHPWRHTVSQHLEEYLWWSKVHRILRWYLKGSCRMNIFKTLDVWWRHISEMTSHICIITCPLIFCYYVIAR